MGNRSIWKYLFMLCLFATALAPCAIRQVAAQDARATEFRVKAVFLYHFTQFVEWPDASFDAVDAPLVIGVLGNDPFGPYLDEAVGAEAVSGHPLVVRRFDSLEAAGACHVLFISTSEENRMDQVLEMTDDRPILTVSAIDDFAEEGGIIQFVTERGKIRLRINHDAAQSAGLTISSKLLRLADIVTAARN